MTIIERMARAICADSLTLRWQDYEPEARRAIEAMREPTDEMGKGTCRRNTSAERDPYGRRICRDDRRRLGGRSR
jgi:hypothetical protein